MSDRRIVRAALALAVAALALAGATADRLAALRVAADLAIAPAELRARPLDADSAWLALGSFRGLAVSAMWIRAQDLEREGRYHASAELAGRIARLQPNMPGVLAFLAHNLAYNIAGAMSDPEARWSWVQAGIRLLRDDGVHADPTNAAHYIELAQTIAQKCLAGVDHAEPHYRRYLAQRWQVILGAPPPDDKDRAAWLAPLATAPPSLDELAQATPAAARVLGIVLELGLALDDTLLARVEAVALYQELAALGHPKATERLAELAPLARALADPELAAGWTALVHYLRARAVRAQGMDPDLMRALTAELGPVDWRHPAAHVLYWAWVGRQRSRPRPNLPAERVQRHANTLDRFVREASRHLVREGRIALDGPTVRRWPAIAMLPAYVRALERERARVDPADVTLRERLTDELADVLTWSARASLYAGDDRAARLWHAELVKVAGVAWSLEEMVWRVDAKGLANATLTLDDARQRLLDLAIRAIELGLAERDGARAHRIYEQATRLRAFVLAHSDATEEQIPSIMDLYCEAFLKYLESPGPDPLRRARAWGAAPLWLRLAVYDLALPSLTKLCLASGLDLVKAFPEPEGLAEYRASRPQDR